MSEYLHFIPYVNGYDLLTRAVNSVQELWANTIIIDNRSDLSLPDPADTSASWYGHVKVTQPIVSLTTAQTMNMMLALSKQQGCEFFTWMHNDGECIDSAGAKLIDYITNDLRDKKWGAVFTNYDVFAGYNVKALAEIGGWDAIRFPYYYLDNDLHNALEAAGYTLEHSGLGHLVLHHNDASNTIKKDRVRDRVNQLTFPVSGQLFREKWGLT